jgi:NAD(P)-dependent dehydrogenase (short-subunit alcohol dehydrogenase family)
MTHESPNQPIALVCGVGPGLGLALVRCFTEAGMQVAMCARHLEPLESWAAELAGDGARLCVYGCDVTSEEEVTRMYRQLQTDLGVPDLVVYNAGAFMPARVTEIQTADFEYCWRVACLGGFLVGREAARLMETRASGTIIFTGATASLRGGAGFANLAVGKAGLRALAQSMARELGPAGIHVGHVIVDGQIRSERHAELARTRPPDGLLEPDAIATNYLHLHRQPRSAWTLELDLRPWVEKF